MTVKLMRFKCVFLVMVFFSFLMYSFAQQLSPPPIVRLIYFLPSDRVPQPDIDEKLDALIKEVQLFYANQMEVHGFGKKTFSIEADAHGKAVVHHVDGQFTDEYYSNLPHTLDIWEEINNRFEASHIYLTAIDTSSGALEHGVCGLAIEGRAFISASGHCFGWYVTAHELAHAFGLHHGDYLTDAKPDRSYTDNSMLNAFCTAEWLDVHRAFNPHQPAVNNKPSTIKMLPPSLDSPPNVIRLRFEVTDPDGIQQVQFFTQGDQRGSPLKWVGCKSLTGTSSSTVEFVTPYLTPKSQFVYLQVMDIHGNSTGLRSVPIDITPLLPAQVVSIPDANLAAAVRASIGPSITTRTLLSLTRLKAHNRQITDITGLEHAHNLEYLNLGDAHAGGPNNNSIANFSPIAGLTQLHTLMLNNAISDVSDISELAALPQLVWLELRNNAITDITPLAAFTQLRYLWLQDNAISDISALSSLTKLTDLHVINNAISDISILARLKHLRLLSLDNNPIANIEPLAGLTQLVILNLSGNTISDVTPLAGLTELQQLYLNNNDIRDVSPLAGLTQLNTLSLLNNSVTNVAPLVELNLTGIRPNIPGLYLEGNPLNYASINTHIPALQAKGIQVKFHNVAKISADINGDGVVNIQDLVLVSSNFGQRGQNSADVNSDGVVNIADLVLVAGEFGE